MTAWAPKNAHASWLVGSTSRPVADQGRPQGAWEWHADTTDGLAAWMREWIAKAAALTTASPSTTVPSSSTCTRSLTRISENGRAKRVDPEPVGVLGIAGGDVSGDPGGEAERREEPEADREPLLAVTTLVGRVVEAGRCDQAHGAGDAVVARALGLGGTGSAHRVPLTKRNVPYAKSRRHGNPSRRRTDGAQRGGDPGANVAAPPSSRRPWRRSGSGASRG